MTRQKLKDDINAPIITNNKKLKFAECDRPTVNVRRRVLISDMLFSNAQLP